MESPQQLLDISVAAEDVIRSLETTILQAEAAIVRRPAREIPGELFPISLALVRASKAAGQAKAELLDALGLPKDTTFVRQVPTFR